MNWIQENIECIISVVLSIIGCVGGISIYLIRRNKYNRAKIKQRGKINQSEIGGNHSTQIQIGEIHYNAKDTKGRG